MPAIEVSCPSCETLNLVEMKVHEDKKERIDNFMADMFMNIMNDIFKQYKFIGENKCSKCGEKITVSIKVMNEKFEQPQNKKMSFALPLGSWPNYE